MFYSQLLLSKKGALGVVWIAAHCYTKLKKDQVQRTDISSSVDKILVDEVPVVAHRILAYLLLGIVRIYSKKVDYLFDDCHDVLNKLLFDFKIRKRERPVSEVSLRDNSSAFSKRIKRSEALQLRDSPITLPIRFELDAFDLGPLEDRDVEDENVRPREELMLKDGWREEGSTSGLLFMENLSFSKDDSTAYTPPRDVLSPHLMDEDRTVSPSCNMKNCRTSPVICRGTSFSLEDRLEPMILYDSEEEEMRDKSSNKRSEPEPNLGDRTEPMMSEEAEKEGNNDRLSNDMMMHNTKVINHDVEFDFVVGPSEEPQKVTQSVDTTEQLVSAGKMKPLETIITYSRRRFEKTEERAMSITVDVTPDSKLAEGGMVTPHFAAVETPAPKERSKVVLKKRRPLFDTTKVVLSDVYKDWLDDPSDLTRRTKEVPHTRLQVWRAHKLCNIHQSFTEPLIPCISVDLRSLEHKLRTFEKSASQVEVKSPVAHEDKERASEVRSPVAHGDKEQAFDVGSPVVHEDKEQAFDVGSPAIQRSPEQAPIAPGTPLTHLNSTAVANSDILGPTSSMENIENVSSPCKEFELDAIFLNETISSDGDSMEKSIRLSHADSDIYLARTRMVEKYLQKNFLHKKRQKKDEVLNLSQLLAGRTKKESAGLFYEILVLKMRDCIDVQQENAYGDIFLCEKSKSKLSLEI